MIVCLDTHILIWGIQKKANPSQIEKIEQASLFLQWLEEKHYEVVIPAPVVAEFLSKIPNDQRLPFADFFNQKYMILPFDTWAAFYYAKVFETKNGLKDAVNRAEIKVDVMIVAISLANKVDVIYSEDKNLQKIAKDFIEVQPLPNLPRQLPINYRGSEGK